MPSLAQSSDSILPPGVRIREKSWLARIGAWKLRSASVALVFGNIIHLWGISPEAFLRQTAWVRHELMHVRQYQRYGRIGFLTRYLYFSARYGYYANPLEREAMEAE